MARRTSRWPHVVAVMWLGCGCSSPPAAHEPTADPTVIEVGAPADGQVAREVDAEPARRAPAKIDTDCVADLLAARHLRAEPAQADELLYEEAHRAMAGGNKVLARKKLLELVESHKGSRFVPAAYLLFGEMFAKEAQKDPSKTPIAANFYREVLKFPPRDNPAFFHASLRLGEMHSLQDNHVRALLDYKRAIEGRHAHTTALCIEGIAAKATEKLIAAYAKVGDPAKAFAFFKPLSGARGGDTEPTFAMMSRLADQLAPANMAAAVTVVNDILSRGPTARICGDLRRLAKAHAQIAAKAGQAIRRHCR